MRGGSGRVFGAAGVVAALFLGAACSGAEAHTGPPLPTFPAAPTSSPAAATGVDDGVLADDCARILPVADLGAVLGLPLETVAVRTTIGVPAPTVGRIERIDCEYRATENRGTEDMGTAGGPARGRVVLDLNGAAYTDDAAARKQWRTNAGVEDGDRRELSIGGASAILVERPREAVLMVVYGSGTLTVVLPGPSAGPGDRPRADVLVDLALRLLPALAAAGPVPPAVDPAEAADAP